jgi:thiamine biosynthesis lipoprotein
MAVGRAPGTGPARERPTASALAHQGRPGSRAGVLLVAALVLLGIVAASGLIGCGPAAAPEPEVTLRGETMGTTYSVKLARLAPHVSAAQLQSGIDALLEEINDRMSTYREDSELSRFNRAQTTDWVAVSPGLAAVVAEALAVSELTAGAFDVTVGPLVNLWGFGPDTVDAGPSPERLGSVRQRVGYTKLHVRASPPALRKERADMYVDLSALAKGYAVDRVAEYVAAAEVTDFLVEIGGEVRGQGRHPRGSPWRIGVERPAAGRGAVLAVLEADEVAIATSGDYRNYREVAGRRVSHIVDPGTGRPVDHALASVTVVHGSAMRADALATALMVLGPTAGYRLAEGQEIAALFIVRTDSGFREDATPALRARYARGERLDG